MEPAVPIDSWIMGMRTANFERGDIVFFGHSDSIYGEQIYIERLVAMPGDKLEIKQGIVYINDSIGEKYWRYKYCYKALGLDVRTLERKEVIRKDEAWSFSDTLYLFLEPSEAIKFSKANLPHFSLALAASGEINENIRDKYGKNWNADNFGPYVLPEGYSFVMGDNRHNSADSRYIGPVRIESLRGIIVL